MRRDEVQAVIDRMHARCTATHNPLVANAIDDCARMLTEALEKSEPKSEPGQKTLLMSARAAFGWNKACHIDGRAIPEMGQGTWIVVEIIRDGMDAEVAHVTAYPKVTP
jgi:hypothetical protein